MILPLLLLGCAPETPTPATCPRYDWAPTVLGHVESPEILEASGLAASRHNPGLLWTHNDSGYSPHLYALDLDGAHRGRFLLEGAVNVDWEDLSLGPGPQPHRPYLYVGDIGDNLARRDAIAVYRVPEPSVGTEDAVLGDVERFTLRWPDGPRDAETLIVDPWTGDLYLVDKVLEQPTGVYRARAPLVDGDTLQRVADLWLGEEPFPGSPYATGGDVSSDGRQVILRTYTHARIYLREHGPLHTAFAREPCPVPLTMELQGEAVAFLPDGSGYVTTSEGAHQPIYRYRVE